MNPEMKTKWLEALRSGEYPKTRNYLQNAGGFCCLGVLCDISGAGEWKPYPGVPNLFDFQIGDKASYLSDIPEKLADFFGLSEDIRGNLMQMNDRGSSFAEIADWIETHL